MKATLGVAAATATLGLAAAATAGVNIVHGNQVPVTPMAAWEEGGAVRVASGIAEVPKAPPVAVRYLVQVFPFPTGTLKVLRFKAAGGALFPLTDEAELFVLSGAISVGVGGRVETLAATDAAYRPSGTLRALPSPEQTTVIAWTVGSLTKDAKSMIVRGAGVRVDPVANWVQPDGKQIYLRGAAQMRGVTPPPEAAQWVSRRYEFIGNSIRWANFREGGKTNLAAPGTDGLIYITKGRMRRTEGPEVEEVKAGDVVREEAGLNGYWELLDDAGFLSTTAPGGARKAGR